MRKCILCGQCTDGSIGAAGIHWSMICQPCKDLEDLSFEAHLDLLATTRAFPDPICPWCERPVTNGGGRRVGADTLHGPCYQEFGCDMQESLRRSNT